MYINLFITELDPNVKLMHSFVFSRQFTHLSKQGVATGTLQMEYSPSSFAGKSLTSMF